MKEVYSLVSGCSRKRHYKRFFPFTFDQKLLTLKEEEEEEEKQILHHILHIFVKHQNLSQLTHLHRATMVSK